MLLMQRDRRRGLRPVALAAVLLAATASAQTQSKCGPANAGCGPAIVNVIGTTTTTLGGTPAPSWVPFMLAAWMLDEPSTTRVNAQGTTSRNLVPSSGTIPNDTVNKMEGTASALIPNGQELMTSDMALVGIPDPFTCGGWMLKDAAASAQVLQTPAWGVGHNNDNNWHWTLGTNLYFGPAATPGTWNHFAIRQLNGVSLTYLNGVSNASATRAYTPPTSGTFYVGYNMVGNVDEFWCAGVGLADASVCRICSCGIRGEQCGCNGAAYVSTGRNATLCNTCTLPACNAATPP